MRQVLRLKHMSIRTEEVYMGWVRRFILFHHKRHPKEMGTEEIREFLTHLAVHDKVAASTQNGALCVLLFLYREVLKQEFPDLGAVEWVKKPRHVPNVFPVPASRLERLKPACWGPEFFTSVLPQARWGETGQPPRH
jgi:Phage integrase, N-terminal SAM-like domain